MFTYVDKNGKTVTGYSYAEAQTHIGAKHQNYVRQLVSQGKIKGGNAVPTDEEVVEGNPIKLTFDVTTDNKPTGGAMLFYDNMSAFEIVKTVLHNKGVSMNYFKELREGATKLGLDTKLVDGGNYTIVLEKPKMIETDDEDYDD